MYTMDLINDKLFDLKLITASDYTATGIITPTQWEYFKKHKLFSTESRAKAWILGDMLKSQNEEHIDKIEANDALKDSNKEKDPKPALKFELEFTEELEKALQQENVSEEMSKVADLQLAFDNAELLRLLELRANYLKAANFDKANELEEKLTQLKNEKFEKFMRPNTFYVTFKYEDTMVKAV